MLRAHEVAVLLGVVVLGVLFVVAGEVVAPLVLVGATVGLVAFAAASRRQAARHHEAAAAPVPLGANVLTVARRSAYADRLRPYRVVADGETIGEVWDGETVQLALPDGAEKAWLRIAWCRSRKVELPAGGGASIACGGRPPPLALFYATLGALRYVEVTSRSEPSSTE